MTIDPIAGMTIVSVVAILAVVFVHRCNKKQ